MFATRATLHGGLMHFVMNLVGLMCLCPMVIGRVGEGAFPQIIGAVDNLAC